MNKKIFDIYYRDADKFSQRLKGSFFSDYEHLTLEVAVSQVPIPFEERESLVYHPVFPGQYWGNEWENGYFKLSGHIPESWRGEAIYISLNLGGEVLIFDKKGVPAYGLTHSSSFFSDYVKDLYEVIPKAKGGEDFELFVEVVAIGQCGNSGIGNLGRVSRAFYGSMLPEVRQLSREFDLLLNLIDNIPDGNYRKNQLVMALSRAIDVYTDNPNNAAKAREILAPELKRRADASALTTIAVGHAHIDVGWLWPVRESIRKAARTFSSQLEYIKRYPNYVFGASQACLYKFVKDHYPPLYEKIKKAVKGGRWEIQGGMWVESDCNITSGESLVRQFLHGKNFFRDEFGVEVKNLWLPDVFGYSAAMPQILKKSGCDYFLTQKISWNQVNKFPHHTFMWRGIDGSEVLTHFPPEDTYNSVLLPKRVAYAQDNFEENYFLNEFMTLYGIGDGGGGPSEDHIERGIMEADIEGVPRVKFGRADEFFDRLHTKLDQLPRWVGELYFELHRGTYTSQARTKRNNRKCEEKLLALEFLSSALAPAAYPRTELDNMWETVLTNQFHDILPGSSIRQVYEDSERDHADVIAKADRLIAVAGSKFTKKNPDKLTLLNTLSHIYRGVVELPQEWCGYQVMQGNKVLPHQYEGGHLWIPVTIEPQGILIITKGKKLRKIEAKQSQSLILENNLVRYVFDENANLLSAYDKKQKRQFIKPGDSGNKLGLYVDIPNDYEAWDIDITYPKRKIENAKSINKPFHISGKVRQKLIFVLRIGSSTLLQEISLESNSMRLDFKCTANWNESRKMLRVAFPTTLCAAEATCDIQYGFVRRSTHANTSWEQARFEVAAQRYVDLSDASGGVALLNDCKYGYRLSDDTLDLNLLRSPISPDPVADLGRHEFTYSFLPHSGGLLDSDIIAESASLNRPPLMLPGDGVAVTIPCRLESDGVSLEVVKRGYKDNSLVIRLVEISGKISNATLICHKARKIVETDLLEWHDGEITLLKEGRTELTLKPFEIRTFKVK